MLLGLVHSFLLLGFLAQSNGADTAGPLSDGLMGNEVNEELPQLSPMLIRQLIHRVESLEAANQAQQQLLSEQGKRLDQQEDLISILRHEIKTNHLKPNEDALLKKMNKMMKYAQSHSNQTGGRTVRAEEDAMVAFTAGLTHDLTNLGADQNIVFDHVETNIGNGYNSHQGVFTAPVGGTYVFHSSILAYYNLEIWCKIVVNGANKADMFARGTDNRHDQGSQLVVVQLNQGDDVSIQNRKAGDAIHSDGAIWTTFSGFLLKPDYSGVVVG